MILRFIPAGAGNTGTVVDRHKTVTVHPRRRGEHAPRRGGRGLTHGSSPQARGTRWIYPCATGQLRFIPAGAGNTIAVAAFAPYVAVHPRRRGEHASSAPTCAARTGSSPQARGTPFCHKLSSVSNRFIPAGAGNTASEPGICDAHAVHPRRRGEHYRVQPREHSY